ncbi:hypothetical protein [Flavobacterium limnosediminis]|nr:hypothetical protein [Flavobacterium limnosediminis]
MGNLRYHLYHTNITTEATYNPKTKKTEYYNYYCPDEELKKILIFLKGSRCNRNKSEMGTIDYSDNIHIKHVGLSIPIKEIAKSLIEFQDSTKSTGTYDEHVIINLSNQEYDLTYLVEFDNNLNKHITPIDIFANSDFGVKKVSNPFYTIELISVSYN